MRYRITAYESSAFDAPAHNVYYPAFKDRFVASAKLNLKLNAIEDLTVVVNKENWLYDHGEPFKTHVNVVNLDNDDELVFRGRLLKVTKRMDSSGNFQQELVFESILSYLLDSIKSYKKASFTPTEFFIEVLGDHNSKVPDDKKIYYQINGIDDTLEPGDNHKYEYEFDYKNSWETIKTMLVDRLKGYLAVKYTVVNNQYTVVLTFNKTPGSDHPDQTVEIAENMLSGEVQIDPTNVVTRLVPLGATQEDLSDPTKDTSTKSRIAIGDSKTGFLSNSALEQQFGVIYGTQIWDDVTDPNKLRQLGEEWMARQIVAVNNWKIDTFETDNRTFYVGHRYQFVNDELAVSQLIRVMEKTVDITSPNNITLTIESTQSTLVDYQVQAKKVKEELAEAKTDLARNKRRTKALVEEVKKLQEENAQLKRDALVREGSGRTVAGGATHAVNGDWGPAIRHASDLMNANVTDEEVAHIKNVIQHESGGSETAVNLWDSNAAAGHPSKGLIQYIDSTFNSYALEGHTNIFSGFDQLLAMFNDSTWRSDLTLGGWGPTGSRRYKKVPNTEASGGVKRLQDAARRYLGVRYVWGGAGGARGGNPFDGMDCSSFVSQVYKDLGINIPAYTVSMEPYGHEIPRSQVQAGDMGFYGSHGGSYHVTLALDNKRMIYEPAPGQSCMEQDINAYPPNWWVRNDQMAAIVAGN